MKVIILAIICLLAVQTVAKTYPEQLIEKLYSYATHLKASNDSCTHSCCDSLPTRSPQTYHYYQKTARFVGGSGAYAIDTKCYSGAGTGLNNPDKQCVSNVGPLPATTYKIGYCKNTMHDPPVQRPCAFYL